MSSKNEADRSQNAGKNGGEKDKHEIEEALHEQDKQNVTREGQIDLTEEERAVLVEGLQVLVNSGVRYAVGAAFARYIYTGIWRTTKDLDVFIHPDDVQTALDAFEAAGFETTRSEEGWLAKACKGEHFIDLIHSAGNEQLPVDDRWFERSRTEDVLGVDAQIAGIEEMIASSVFVATRNRFDGAEVMHLIWAVEGKLDWQRIVNMLGEHRQLLLWHLILFNYIYPRQPQYLPQELMVQLFEEMRQRWKNPSEMPHAFRGTILDDSSFAVDVEDWGYEDHRRDEHQASK